MDLRSPSADSLMERKSPPILRLLQAMVYGVNFGLRDGGEATSGWLRIVFLYN
jgi:hypothetical protein